MCVHCDLNEFIMLNEQMEEEGTTRPNILHFFGQEKFRNLEKLCLWQPCVHVHIFLCTNEVTFAVKYSTQYPTLHHTVLGQVI